MSHIYNNLQGQAVPLTRDLFIPLSRLRIVASWLTAPETSVLAEFVRPDFLMLKVSGKMLNNLQGFNRNAFCPKTLLFYWADIL